MSTIVDPVVTGRALWFEERKSLFGTLEALEQSDPAMSSALKPMRDRLVLSDDAVSGFLGIQRFGEKQALSAAERLERGGESLPAPRSPLWPAVLFYLLGLFSLPAVQLVSRLTS